jgi:hypothetical protein
MLLFRDSSEVPGGLTKLVANMIKNLEIKRNCFFLTMDNKMVLKGASQEELELLDVTLKFLLGWRPRRLEMGEGGRLISSTEHKACYQKYYWRHAHRVNNLQRVRMEGSEGDIMLEEDCTRIQLR